MPNHDRTQEGAPVMSTTPNGEVAPAFSPATGNGSWRRWLPLVLVLAIGAGLRSMQYFEQVGMWHDELAVARNVDDRNLSGLLTRPLDHDQVTPVGFLAMVEATTAALAVTEAGLRLGPWILSLASLPLFWRVADRFAGGSGLLVPLALFAVSPALVWHGSSVKPYGSDVTISLLLVLLALRHLESPSDVRRGLLAGAVGAVAIMTKPWPGSGKGSGRRGWATNGGSSIGWCRIA
jgi:hypothetical protein